MTVAAIVLVPDTQMALADAHGEPAVRRVLQAAWSGGALPVVAVLRADSAMDSLANAIADLPVTIVRPSEEIPHGIGRFVAGLDAALEAVTETAAGLLWPVRYAWIDPETVTSLVEAHGSTPESIVRPAFAGDVGFPVLVPVAARATLLANPAAPGGAAIEYAIGAGVPARTVELGDPGIVHDLGTDWGELPAFEGPDQPLGRDSPGEPAPEPSGD